MTGKYLTSDPNSLDIYDVEYILLGEIVSDFFISLSRGLKFYKIVDDYHI